jgi:hypothetical protein
MTGGLHTGKGDWGKRRFAVGSGQEFLNDRDSVVRSEARGRMNS